MNKLELAHEYSKVLLTKFETITVDQIVDVSFSLAELMLAEDEKRKDKSRPEVLEEFEIDWRMVPIDYKWFCVDSLGFGLVFKEKPDIFFNTSGIGLWGINDACSGDMMVVRHKYNGDWKDSLRKRP
ncbi:hypothetical protein AVT64_gp50 [Acinetobacter phage YMC11/12/R2315]|uniref:Uncharacterized protein n=3 Tax=Obolenskvirus AbC62 TaxID=1915206 RepID=A0A0D4DC34_9CAUD|nr:hypothetical protein LD30_gp13 [Acinetobacter phage YMC-13-01-C62]YP_009203569.1 hypothetical protein AVT64_gp50 [Acinetobacter phage YMC11/12/R2315]AJT61450.1 hypothetical protein ABA1215_00540 [Acinetobacter phage YMC11/12/R1215]WNT46086.1 hypothetical protein [Acinetobacter phage P115]WNT46335.1 hypothetical protein [Acinetobacter phage P711]WNT46417.1 hypothetical protein [Acinetobacter phage A2.1]WNT46502.1 hypothetical protein [Acinetobacter phage A832.1]